MKKLLSTFLFCCLVFNFVSCASKKKDLAPPLPGDEVSKDAMSFDPMGSDSGNIAGLKSVNFETDRSHLSEEAKSILEATKFWMEEKSNVQMQIEGHCDSRGSNEYNLALGQRRARAVYDYLIKLGLSESRLSTTSYGEERPMAAGDGESDYATNRRANFLPISN